MVPLLLVAAVALQDVGRPAVAERYAGQRLEQEHYGPSWVEDAAAVLAREAAAAAPEPSEKERNGRQGRWRVPTRSSLGVARSGLKHIANEWGDTRMAIGFPGGADVAGFWVAGLAGEPLWPEELVVSGYAGGERVATGEPFTAFDEEPAWVALGFTAVDRLVIQALPRSGGPRPNRGSLAPRSAADADRCGAEAAR